MTNENVMLQQRRNWVQLRWVGEGIALQTPSALPGISHVIYHTHPRIHAGVSAPWYDHARLDPSAKA